MGDIISLSNLSQRRTRGVVLDRPPSDGTSAQTAAEGLDARRSFPFLIERYLLHHRRRSV